MGGNDALGKAIVLQFEGKALLFAPPDAVEVVGLYECYLEDQAWAALERIKKRLLRSDPEEYERQSDGIRRDVVSGVYAYGSRYWLESIRSLGHQKRLLHLMAQFHDPELPADVIDRIYEQPEKLKELLKKAFRGVVDPNDGQPTARQSA